MAPEDDEHGIDLEDDTDLDTAGGDDPAPEEDDPTPEREVGREDADDQVREEEAAAQENPDAHRDEEPYQS